MKAAEERKPSCYTGYIGYLKEKPISTAVFSGAGL